MLTSRRIVMVLGVTFLIPSYSSDASAFIAIKNHTLVCGYERFYFSADGQVTRSDGLESYEKTVPVIQEPDGHVITARIPMTSEKKVELVKFRKSGRGYTVQYPGSAAEFCSASKGKQELINNRHEAARELVCGNDPFQECIDELVKLCGKPASERCAKQYAKRLQAVSETASMKH